MAHLKRLLVGGGKDALVDVDKEDAVEWLGLEGGQVPIEHAHDVRHRRRRVRDLRGRKHRDVNVLPLQRVYEAGRGVRARGDVTPSRAGEDHLLLRHERAEHAHERPRAQARQQRLKLDTRRAAIRRRLQLESTKKGLAVDEWLYVQVAAATAGLGRCGVRARYERRHEAHQVVVALNDAQHLLEECEPWPSRNDAQADGHLALLDEMAAVAEDARAFHLRQRERERVRWPVHVFQVWEAELDNVLNADVVLNAGVLLEVVEHLWHNRLIRRVAREPGDDEVFEQRRVWSHLGLHGEE